MQVSKPPRYTLVILLLLLVIASAHIPAYTGGHLEIKVLYRNGKPAQGLEVVLSEPIPMFKCGREPKNVYTYTITNKEGLALFNLSYSVNKVCIFIKYNGRYIDLDPGNAYNNGKLIDLIPNNYTVEQSIVLDMQPPTITDYNLTIIIHRIRSRPVKEIFSFWILIEDNNPSDLQLNAYLYSTIKNASTRLVLKSKTISSNNPMILNASFGLNRMSIYEDFIGNNLDKGSLPYIIVEIRDAEGFMDTLRINVTKYMITIIDIKSNETNVIRKLSNETEYINVSPGNSASMPPEERYIPQNISREDTVVEKDDLTLMGLNNIFIPVIGIATVILEIWRRRSIQ